MLREFAYVKESLGIIHKRGSSQSSHNRKLSEGSR